MNQSNQYKNRNEVNRVADQVGADHAKDAIRVMVVGQDGDGLDVTGEVVEVVSTSVDSNGEIDKPLEADGSVTVALEAEGAAGLVGRVHRLEAQYSVLVHWQTEGGDTLFTDTVASGVSGAAKVEEPAIAPRVEVEIKDTSGNTKNVTHSFQLR